MPYESIEDILAHKISMLSVHQIEEFFGRELSAKELERAESIIHEKLDGMEENELLEVEEMFWNFDDPNEWESWLPSEKLKKKGYRVWYEDNIGQTLEILKKIN